MAAEAAYRQSAYPERSSYRQNRPDVRVVPGSRTGAEPKKKGVTTGLIIKLAIAVMVVATVVCFAQITLKSATSVMLADSSAIESSMDSIKSNSTTLEVQNSALSTTAAIKAHAEKLGMAAPYEVDTITLQKDIVATDDSGALSLSGSIKNAAEIQG